MVDSSVAEVLRTPSAKDVDDCSMSDYQRWLREVKDVDTKDYRSLWRWSVSDIEAFWTSIWDCFDVLGSRGPTALSDPAMPGAQWFAVATVTWAAVNGATVEDLDWYVGFAENFCQSPTGTRSSAP